MAIARRRKRIAKRGVLVRFQPWLVAGGVFLNVIASGGAAVSAWFSWKQTGIAIEAVNIESRNQAFSEYLAAFTAVCEVSLIPQDQDDMWTFRANQENYDPARTELFEVRELHEEQIEPRTPEQVDTWIEEASKKREAMWAKWMQLQIWLDDQAMQDLSEWGPDYSRSFLDDTKMPAAYYAVEQQRRCRLLRDAVVTLYKNPNDNTADAKRWMRMWVLPVSETRSTEEILNGWGRQDILVDLKTRGIWPLPQ